MEGQATDALIPMSEGVKILYKESVDNVIFLKKQQWTITNYSLVAFAAVVALSKGSNNVESTLLTVIAFGAWLYATICMIHTQMTLTKYRARLVHIYHKYFHEEEREAFTFWDSAPTFSYTPVFIYGLLGANLISFAATVYLIWRVTPTGAIT
jgi:hypothetical protein